MTNPVRSMNLGSATDTALPSPHCSLAVFFPLKSSLVCSCGLASGLVMPGQVEFFRSGARCSPGCGFQTQCTFVICLEL